MSDIIVIGGGIAGISAGARLSHLGRVTVLERESSLAYHASGRSAALFEATYGSDTVVALNRASADYHQHANGGVTSPRGTMLVGSAALQDSFEAEVRKTGLRRLDPDEARALFPILNDAHAPFAAHDPKAWDLDTDRLIQNFARELRDNGGQIVTGAEVTAIRRTATGWDVTTPKGDFAGALLVNAAGAWVDKVAGLAGIAPIGFTPLRRSMARIPAPGGLDTSRWPMVFGANDLWYCKPDAGALIVSPSEEDPAEPHDAWPDDMVLAEGLARYEEAVTEPVTRLLASWAGLRTFAPDRTLVIGPSPEDAGFLWFAGQGGYGFQTAPAASALLADIVAARPPEIGAELAGALSPTRFGA
ncbi:MAG: FAD-dependent oxidoreductase [Limimaricola sp.]|uniref:NAD(P)/FAD-dependent oxidoreductase n=1 Tax=Limimaricola sp. TaxID=2211665 RepID=UPI001DAFFE82|nr:FAD-dependent oxidoreductase [Limimaricola sp.]MBI1417758.1 FAD-dependent oxidoreductase [Limimaricola sp.]